jgi:hypothetical protein
MKRFLRLTALLLAVLTPLIAGSAAYADSRPRPWLSGIDFVKLGLRACGGDIATFCGRTIPGQGRIVQCLADQYDDLSEPCQRYIDKSFDVRNVLFACTADAERYCPGVLPGGGRVAACLFEQRDVISEACDKAVSRVMEEPQD